MREREGEEMRVLLINRKFKIHKEILILTNILN